jgi:4-hydroxy-tetrahydrodipicolinate reductase
MSAKLIVTGAGGRMGQRIIALGVESGQFDIVGAVEVSGHPDIGKVAGPAKVELSDSFAAGADVVIDFSQPEGADATIDYCVENGAALVMGTTGLSEGQHERIEAAAKKIPLIYGTNMSVGMNVLFSLVGKAAKMLGDDYDIEIIEQHHRFKKDAPSGSALTLGENICKATGKDFPGSLNYGREGKEALRKKGEIGVHAIRAGDIAGIHSVIYSTLGETVTLAHNAHSRDGFAKGALTAAGWLIGKEPGQYTMADVLGIC